jgi:hypothetical protein
VEAVSDIMNLLGVCVQNFYLALQAAAGSARGQWRTGGASRAGECPAGHHGGAGRAFERGDSSNILKRFASCTSQERFAARARAAFAA